MSIEVLQRQLGPDFFARFLKRIAPHGWNANTQFFLVFLTVLGLHLWLAPMFVEWAGRSEPGDRQGYLTSGPEAPISESPTPVKTAPSGAAETETSDLLNETLVLTDTPPAAEPVSESADETTETPASPEPAVPEKTAAAKSEFSERIPAPSIPETAEAVPAVADSAPPQPEPQPETKQSAPDKAPSASPAKEKEKLVAKPAVPLPAAEEEVSGPRLSDLISDSDADAGKTPPAGQTSPSSRHSRVFRQLR